MKNTLVYCKHSKMVILSRMQNKNTLVYFKHSNINVIYIFLQIKSTFTIFKNSDLNINMYAYIKIFVFICFD